MQTRIPETQRKLNQTMDFSGELISNLYWSMGIPRELACGVVINLRDILPLIRLEGDPVYAQQILKQYEEEGIVFDERLAPRLRNHINKHKHGYREMEGALENRPDENREWFYRFVDSIKKFKGEQNELIRHGEKTEEIIEKVKENQEYRDESLEGALCIADIYLVQCERGQRQQIKDEIKKITTKRPVFVHVATDYARRDEKTRLPPSLDAYQKFVYWFEANSADLIKVVRSPQKALVIPTRYDTLKEAVYEAEAFMHHGVR